MTDMYSDDEDYEDEESGPIVVEVKGRGGHSPTSARRSPHGHSPTSARRSPHGQKRSPAWAQRRTRRHDAMDDDDEDLSDEYSDEHDEDDDEEYNENNSARKSARRHRSSRSGRPINGKKGINMTTPDVLLDRAQKKAWKLEDKGKVDLSIKERVKILALTRIVYGSSHWRLAEAHVNLGEAYLELKGYNAQAEYHTENAMTIMLSSVTTTTTEQEKSDVFGILFRLNYVQGKALMALKKFQEADAAFMKADRAYQACSKLSCVTDDHCDEMEIKLTEAVARLSWRQKKYAVAGTQYDKVLDLTIRRFGEDAIELIPLYQECGRLEQSKGKHANHEKAIELFLQAHSIAGAHYKDASVELVDTALALANAYASTGREEAEISAKSYLNECLRNCTVVHGPHHKKTLEVQDELARLLIRTEREQEALEMLRSSIPLKGEVFGDYSESVSDTHKLIASIHLAQGNIEKSLRCYKKCLDIESLVLGKNHKKTKDTERTIDILMASPGLNKRFVLNKQEQLKNRPRFNAISK